jgi:L-lactate dehydrogenase
MKTIAVIGAGDVGAHIVNAGMSARLEAQFYLVDINKELSASQVLDLKDSQLPAGKSLVEDADFSHPDVQSADIYVITAGVKQKPGESRCSLLGRNKVILESIKEQLPSIKPEAIVMLVTNPVDILTQIANELFSLPQGQVFGTGTILDTNRFHWRLAKHLSQQLEDVSGYVLGEHGDSGFIAWSTVHTATVINNESKNTMETDVRSAAHTIIDGKGSTYFGVSAMVTLLLRAIIHNSQKVLPVSTSLKGQYGLHNIALGVPAVIGSQGVQSVIELELTPKEQQQLQNSAAELQKLFTECSLHS